MPEFHSPPIIISPLSILPRSPTFHQILQSHGLLISLGLSLSRSVLSHLLCACALSSPSPPPPSYPLSLFLLIPNPSPFASNNLLRCLPPLQSLSFYRSLPLPLSNSFTFPILLRSCSSLPSLPFGSQLHSLALKLSFSRDLYVRNALITFYSSCGLLSHSRAIFSAPSAPRDLVSWNAMLSACIRNSDLHSAERIFDRMPDRDAISWSTLIAGYVRIGALENALRLFARMISACSPSSPAVNEATLVTVLSASAQLGLLRHGIFVHSVIRDLGFPLTAAVGTALVDMYAKCGCIDRAGRVFDGMRERDAFAWNAMICGTAAHGKGKEAVELFRRFVDGGLRPTAVTFVGVLNACSRAGLVDEGRRFFGAMRGEYGVEPEMEHYGCMVDLFGRAGLVAEALELIEGMSMRPDSVLWATLLGACKMHGFVELGIVVGRKLIELEPGHDGHYVLLAALYAKAGRWEDVVEVRKLMSSHGTSKAAGWSLIEADGKIHRFIAGDLEHEESDGIYKMIGMVGKRLVEAGYLPDVSSVLHDIEDEEKMHVINVHSERLAIAYGLMIVDRGLPIRIVKNLRVCADCHEYSKMVSKVLGREIIVRDGSRFHHFRDGSCSCLDYW